MKMEMFRKIFFLLIFLILLNLSFSAESTTQVYNVLAFGAKPDGAADSTRAFLSAWAEACSSSNAAAHISIPKGRYILGSAVFEGSSCRSSNIFIRNDGTLVAPPDYNVIAKYGKWLSFEHVHGITISGGILDARGSNLWACKAASDSCPLGATTLTITESSNFKMSRVTLRNSQLFHIVINSTQNVNVQGLQIRAPGNSPNTDGIHVQYSTNVNIFNTSITTGDDCISIGPGSTNLWIQSLSCGPGHGVSIGSLGWNAEEEGVQNVTVRKVVFRGSINGFRIKTWARPSNCFVRGVHFEGAIMQNVQNPILIDQNYCPHKKDCPGQESGIEISDVTYRGITGTSANEIAIRFDCSGENPCTAITLKDVNLSCSSPTEIAQSSCTNVMGQALGLIHPPSCLDIHTKKQN